MVFSTKHLLSNLRVPLNLIRSKIRPPFVIETNSDYRCTVFLAGTARSGTTWVSDIINYKNEYRYIFEPLNCRRVPMTVPFGSRRYLRPDDDEPELQEIMGRILAGRIRSLWTERFNRRFISSQRLVKEVRANLLLKWMHQKFTDIPIVLVIRHPCAVAYSYERQGWRGAVEPLLGQEMLVKDYLEPFKEEIAATQDVFERAVWIWCIETLIPLLQFRSGELHLIFYEKLLVDSEEEIQSLFEFLSRNYDTSALDWVDHPSLTSRRYSAVRMGDNRLVGWRSKISKEQHRRALDIVERFGLSGLYGDGFMPNEAAVLEILRR